MTPTIRRVALATATLAAAFWCLAGNAGAYVYWSEGDAIGRANLDGSQAATGFVLTPASSVAVDASQIYWSFGEPGSPGTISAAPLAASAAARVIVADAGEEPRDVVVGDGHIYWIQGPGIDTSIGRAELPDGGNPEPDFLPGVDAAGLAVDAERLYWSDGFTADKIESFDFAGQTINHDVVAATTPVAIAVGGGRIYWYDSSGNGIEGATLVGGQGVGAERLVEGAQASALAADADHIYWASGAESAIGRADPDGAEVERDLIRVDGPDGLALDSGFSPPPPPPPPPAVRAPASAPTPATPAQPPTYAGPTKTTTGALAPGVEGALETPKQCVAGGQKFSVKVSVKSKGSRSHKASYSVAKVKFLLGGKVISTDRRKPFEVTFPGSPAARSLAVVARISVILHKGHRHGLATKTLKATVKTCG